MRYIRLNNKQPVDYSIEQLLIDYPNAVIYENSQMPSEELLLNYNVYPLITTPQPEFNDDETAEESTPELINGEWHQTWSIRKLFKEEIDKIIDDFDLHLDTDEIDADETIFAEDSLQQHRYETCKNCSSFTILETCSENGGIIPLKIKAKDQNCPMYKW